MKEQLTKYVELLFAGTSGTEEIRQEILQNTLDKYDDLVAQGKTPEAAYRLSIAGIGDIDEIIGSGIPPAPVSAPRPQTMSVAKKLLKAGAILLYIICPIPLFILSELGMETIGLCGTIGIAAVATVLLFLSGGINASTPKKNVQSDQRNELNKAIDSLLGIMSLLIYLGISFATNAWWITWLVFPIMGSVNGLIKACIDLKEATNNEG